MLILFFDLVSMVFLAMGRVLVCGGLRLMDDVSPSIQSNGDIGKVNLSPASSIGKQVNGTTWHECSCLLYILCAITCVRV